MSAQEDPADFEAAIDRGEFVPYPRSKRFIGQPVSLPVTRLAGSVSSTVREIADCVAAQRDSGAPIHVPNSRRQLLHDTSNYAGSGGWCCFLARLLTQLYRYPFLRPPSERRRDADAGERSTDSGGGGHECGALPPSQHVRKLLQRLHDDLMRHVVEALRSGDGSAAVFDLRAGVGWFSGLPGTIVTCIANEVALAAASSSASGTGAEGPPPVVGTMARALVAMAPRVASSELAGVNEVLYGRAGYLSCLGALYRYGAVDRVKDHDRAATTSGGVSEAALHGAADRVIAAIFHDGLASAVAPWPLLWPFHGKHYLGAAHGVSGIVYVLLSWIERLSPSQKDVLTRTLAVLGAAVYYPCASSAEELGHEDAEELTHWCHGPTGHVSAFVKAHHLALAGHLAPPKDGDIAKGVTSYEQVAVVLAKRVQQHGLLRKGVGLCHGVGGSGYALLSVFRLTNDVRWLHGALTLENVASHSASYAKAVSTYRDPQRAVRGVPDMPLSLMEGRAGYACFLVDLLAPRFSSFPGYESTTGPPVMDWVASVHRPLSGAAPAVAIHAPPQAGAAPNERITDDDDDDGCTTITPPAAAGMASMVLAPGVWALPLMDPDFADRLLDDVYAGAPGDAKKVDAIRISRKHGAVVAAVAAFVERFTHSVMLEANAGPMFRGTDATANATTAGDDVVGSRSSAASHTPLPDFPRYRTNPLLHGEMQRAVEHEDIERGLTDAAAHHDLWPPAHLALLRVWRAYVIRYTADDHPSIQSHTDACDVTVNLCLRRTCSRGHLVFNASGAQYRHVPGEAVVFWGDKVHHTHSVAGAGERAQLVLLLNFAEPASGFIGANGKLQAPTPMRALKAASLNDDVIQDVLSFLPLRDIAVAAYACKRFGRLCTADALWFQLYQRNAALQSFLPDPTRPLACVECDTVYTADVEAEHLEMCHHCLRPRHAYGCDAVADAVAAGSRQTTTERLRHGRSSCSECRAAARRASTDCGPNGGNSPLANGTLAVVGTDGVPMRALFQRRGDLGGDVSDIASRRVRFRHAIAASHSTSRFFDVEVDRDDGRSVWRAVYRRALEHASQAEEELRASAREAEQSFWRAIIGMYPVHNLRSLRRAAPAASGLDTDDSFASCPECSVGSV